MTERREKGLTLEPEGLLKPTSYQNVQKNKRNKPVFMRRKSDKNWERYKRNIIRTEMGLPGPEKNDLFSFQEPADLLKTAIDD